jgi:hypothetical protein
VPTLTKKNGPFKWTHEFEVSFNNLKELLAIENILYIPNLRGNYVVVTNACNSRIGDVLMQEGRVICYDTGNC